MPTIADNSVCIRRWDFSESSQVVSHFTREHGMIRGLAKGAKRDKGTFSGGMDVLTRGQIVAITKPGRDLATLTQWSLEEVFWAARQNLAANRAALYMADLVHHMLTEHDPHPLLFDAMVASLRKLEQPSHIGEALLEFQWALLREAGYQPELASDIVKPPSTGAVEKPLLFSPRRGGFVSSDGNAENDQKGPLWRVRPATVDLLRRVATGETVESDSETVGRANRLLASYIREIAGSELPTTRWAFPDRRGDP